MCPVVMMRMSDMRQSTLSRDRMIVGNQSGTVGNDYVCVVCVWGNSGESGKCGMDGKTWDRTNREVLGENRRPEVAKK